MAVSKKNTLSNLERYNKEISKPNPKGPKLISSISGLFREARGFSGSIRLQKLENITGYIEIALEKLKSDSISIDEGLLKALGNVVLNQKSGVIPYINQDERLKAVENLNMNRFK